MPVTIYPTNLKYKNQNGQFQSATAIKGDSGKAVVEQVNGTTPTIVCEDNHRYICGEVLSLTITPPANGACEIIFESGSTATLLVVPNTMKWPEWFNPNALEANATYQFKLSNSLANVAIWPDEGLTGDTRVRIQKMLGIYEAPWELIREDTFTNTEEADHIITVDGNGQPFELTDVAIAFTTPTQETQAKLGGDGTILFYYGASDYLATWNGQWTQAANTSAYGTLSIIESRDGLVQTKSLQSSKSVVANLKTSWASSLDGRNMGINLISNFAVSKVVIRAVTGTGKYKLYGKRKWQ